MSNYTKSTNFAAKDTLPSGDANKIVKGTEIDTEFNNIATAISTKADTASPTFTGTTILATANINTANITGGSITGITDLAVADGGTGVSSLTANNVILGNGTSAVQFVAPGSSGNVLASNGTTWQSTAPSINLATQATGTLPVGNGGTGATTLTANNVLLGNGTSAVQTVAPGASGNLLTSNGTTWTSAAPATPAVPSFGAVGSIAILFNFSRTNVAAGNNGGISSASLGYASSNIVAGTAQVALSVRRAGDVTVPGASIGGVHPNTTAVSGTWMSLSGCGASVYDGVESETTANTGLFVRTA